MRKGQLRRWLDKVPTLKDYRNLVVLRNPQMPAVSCNNCDPGDYEKVVHAIERNRPEPVVARDGPTEVNLKT
jgi:hypothetical protein